MKSSNHFSNSAISAEPLMVVILPVRKISNVEERRHHVREVALPANELHSLDKFVSGKSSSLQPKERLPSALSGQH